MHYTNDKFSTAPGAAVAVVPNDPAANDVACDERCFPPSLPHSLTRLLLPHVLVLILLPLPPLFKTNFRLQPQNQVPRTNSRMKRKRKIYITNMEGRGKRGGRRNDPWLFHCVDGDDRIALPFLCVRSQNNRCGLSTTLRTYVLHSSSLTTQRGARTSLS